MVFPLIVQIEGKVDGIFTHAFNPHHMADGGNAHAFTGVLKGVNCGLHLIHKGFRRLLEGTVDDHQLHGSAHGQLAIGSRRMFQKTACTADPEEAAFLQNPSGG